MKSHLSGLRVSTGWGNYFVVRWPSRRRTWFALLAVAVVVAVAVPVAVLATGGSAPPSARVRRWREDIAYLASELPQVRAAGLGPVSRAAWASAASRLEAAVPQLTDGQLLVGLARMVAMLHDDETYLLFPAKPFFPLDAQWFGHDLYLLTVPATDRAVLGAQVLAVDGQPIARVMDRIGSVIGYQDTGYLDVTETGDLDDASVLYWLGITRSASSAEFTVRTTTGRQQTVLFRTGRAAGDIGQPDLLFSFVPGLAHVPLPLYLHDAAEPYWLDVLASQHAVYLKYNQCVDTTGFQQLVAQAVALLNRNPGYRLIVDLRDNVGGDSGPFGSLVNDIETDPQLDRPGRIIGLVNQFTFSAARADVVALQQAHVLLMGVPPEDPIDEYGDDQALQLPDSDITVVYTSGVVNGSAVAQGTPGVVIAPTLHQVLAGQDPVLAAALGYGRGVR
jgi:hypothetical protein